MKTTEESLRYLTREIERCKETIHRLEKKHNNSADEVFLTFLKGQRKSFEMTRDFILERIK